MPSKTPIGVQFDAIMPERLRYSPADLLQQQHRQGRRVRLVIDLTKSTRYYHPSEFTDLGVEHAKLPCGGHDGPPALAEVHAFYVRVQVAREAIRAEEAEQRARSEADAKRGASPREHLRPVIVVHCTHGCNRTGAMLVHFGMRFNPMPDLAGLLEAFARCRPPGIYKPDYVDSLAAYYHEQLPPSLRPSGAPPWRARAAQALAPFSRSHLNPPPPPSAARYPVRFAPAR